jgi:predicted RNA-binding Zn ribbon-like protein
MKFQIIAGELCLDFINTFDNRPVPERYKELLVGYKDLVEFVAQAGGIDPYLQQNLISAAEAHPAKATAVLTRALELRETLYRILKTRLDPRKVEETDWRAFSAMLGEALSQRELQATRTGFRLEWPKDPVSLEAVWWPIADSAARLLTSHDLALIRECGARTCRWMFLDRSKNHSRRWCDMKVCGNRIKARKFYRRARTKRQHA